MVDLALCNHRFHGDAAHLVLHPVDAPQELLRRALPRRDNTLAASRVNRSATRFRAMITLREKRQVKHPRTRLGQCTRRQVPERPI